MRRTLNTICAWAGAALLGFAGSAVAANVPAARAHAATPDIAGTYELVKREMPMARKSSLRRSALFTA